MVCVTLTERFRQYLRSVRDSPQWTASIEMPGVEPVTAFTIDPEGCKDFDDAFTVARDGAGWIVNVHIADVCTFIDTFWSLEVAWRVFTVSVFGYRCPGYAPGYIV